MVDSVLVQPEDLDGVRALLGVTKADANDDTITSALYDGAVELDVRSIITAARWDAIVTDAGDDLLRLRLSVMNLIGSRLAETKMHGGTLGLVRRSERDEIHQLRNWDKLAADLKSAGRYWLDKILDLGGPDPEVVYDLRGLRMASATRLVWRTFGIRRNRWWSFPPVVGVPPNWPAFDPTLWGG